MNNSDLKKYIATNIFTISDVQKFLNISRQSVYNLIKSKKIKPIEDINTVLFLKNEIIQLKNGSYYNQLLNSINKNRKIYGGSTRKALEDFNRLIKDVNSINTIKVYFNQNDAIMDNYFVVSDDYCENTLVNVESPTMVICCDNPDDDLWLYGCNCGYIGEGPGGSEEILKKVGVSDKVIENLINKKVTFFKENNIWTSEKYNSINDNIIGHIYFFNDNLVLLEDKYDLNKYRKDKINNFIKKYSYFIPQPIKLYAMSREYAIANGRYININGSYSCYQIAIQDISGRELWLHGNISDLHNLSNNELIKNILKNLGFNNISENKSNIISNWLNKRIHLDFNEIELDND